MKKTLITGFTGALIGILLGEMGYTVCTWQFWLMWVLITALFMELEFIEYEN